jgi:hypothetical protein
MGKLGLEIENSKELSTGISITDPNIPEFLVSRHTVRMVVMEMKG